MRDSNPGQLYWWIQYLNHVFQTHGLCFPILFNSQAWKLTKPVDGSAVTRTHTVMRMTLRRVDKRRKGNLASRINGRGILQNVGLILHTLNCAACNLMQLGLISEHSSSECCLPTAGCWRYILLCEALRLCFHIAFSVSQIWLQIFCTVALSVIIDLHISKKSRYFQWLISYPHNIGKQI